LLPGASVASITSITATHDPAHIAGVATTDRAAPAVRRRCGAMRGSVPSKESAVGLPVATTIDASRSSSTRVADPSSGLLFGPSTAMDRSCRALSSCWWMTTARAPRVFASAVAQMVAACAAVPKYSSSPMVSSSTSMGSRARDAGGGGAVGAALGRALGATLALGATPGATLARGATLAVTLGTSFFTVMVDTGGTLERRGGGGIVLRGGGIVLRSGGEGSATASSRMSSSARSRVDSFSRTGAAASMRLAARAGTFDPGEGGGGHETIVGACGRGTAVGRACGLPIGEGAFCFSEALMAGHEASAVPSPPAEAPS